MKIVSTYRARQNVEKYAYVASIDEIRAQNEFNLNIPRYVDTFEEEDEIDIKTVQREIEQIEAELADARARMANNLEELSNDF